MKYRVLTLMAVIVLAGSLRASAQDPVEKLQKEVAAEIEKIGRQGIEALSKVVASNVKTLIAKHEAAIKERDGRISKLEGDVAKLDGELKSATKSLTDRAAALAKAEASLAEARNQLDAHGRELAALKSKLDALAKPQPKPAEPTNAFFGVSHKPVSAALRESLKLDGDRGVEVVSVFPGGPAERAGLLPGDVIVALAESAIGPATLENAVRSRDPGAKVAVSYLREGKQGAAEVTLVDRDAYVEALPKPKPKPEPKPVPRVDAAYFGIQIEEQEDKSLVVMEVEDGQTAAVAKIAVGDVLTKVNGKALASLDDLHAILPNVKHGESVSFELSRGDATVTSTVTAAKKGGEAKLVESSVAVDSSGKPATLGAQVEFEEGGKRISVKGVTEGTAAAAFGLQAGDVFVSVNGAKIEGIDSLKEAIGGKVSGETLDVVVRRGKATVTLRGVRLGAKGEVVAAPKGFKPHVELPKVKGWIGFQLLEFEGGPVVVETVDDGGPADRAKLRRNDELLKVNGVDVKTIDDVEKALEKAWAGTKIALLLKRGDTQESVEITLGERPDE